MFHFEQELWYLEKWHERNRQQEGINNSRVWIRLGKERVQRASARI